MVFFFFAERTRFEKYNFRNQRDFNSIVCHDAIFFFIIIISHCDFREKYDFFLLLFPRRRDWCCREYHPSAAIIVIIFKRARFTRFSRETRSLVLTAKQKTTGRDARHSSLFPHVVRNVSKRVELVPLARNNTRNDFIINTYTPG